MTPEAARILRECAVDLVRASDSEDETARRRIEIVLRELGDIHGDLNAELRLVTAYRRKPVAA